MTSSFHFLPNGISQEDQILDKINGAYKVFFSHTINCYGGDAYHILEYVYHLIYTESSKKNIPCNVPVTLRWSPASAFMRSEKTVYIPDIAFLNLEFVFRNHMLYISFIPISPIIAGEGQAAYIIISYDDQCFNIDDFVKTSMNFCLYRDYDPDTSFKVYTYNISHGSGNWTYVKANHKRTLDTLYYNPETIMKIENKINTFIKDSTRELYKKLGIPYKLNILIYGPPGTGKSSYIETVASKLNKHLYFLQLRIDMTDNDLHDALNAIPSEGHILVLEDIDCMFANRKSNDANGKCISFSGLLNAFDGVVRLNGLIVFMTTNYKCRLDNALIRPGRVDYMVSFDFLTEEPIRNMIQTYTKDTVLKSDDSSIHKFIQRVKSCNIKLTGAMLCNYLLNCVLDGNEDLLEKFDLLQEMSKECKYDDPEFNENEPPKNMYL